MEKLSGVRQSV